MKYHKKQYDKTAQYRKMVPGQMVWLFNITKKPGRSPKLQKQWEKEPYTITEVLSDMVIEITKPGTNKTKVVHINNIKLVGDQKKWTEWRETKKRHSENTTIETSPQYKYGTAKDGFPCILQRI